MLTHPWLEITAETKETVCPSKPVDDMNTGIIAIQLIFKWLLQKIWVCWEKGIRVFQDFLSIYILLFISSELA